MIRERRGWRSKPGWGRAGAGKTTRHADADFIFTMKRSRKDPRGEVCLAPAACRKWTERRSWRQGTHRIPHLNPGREEGTALR